MTTIHVTEIISESKFKRFHLNLLLWSIFIILFDGYDLVVYGSVVPHLIKDWHLTTIEAGAIGSYGLFGVMLGAFFFGPLADRIGRKNVILICILIFSFFTALSGFALGPKTFSVYRFIAGLGLGGIMPNVIALTTDYAPKKMKSILVSIVLCGYSVGGMLAPLLSIQLAPFFGWESVYWVAGFPLLILPFLFKYLPESTNFLLEKGRLQELRKTLKQIQPDLIIQEQDRFVFNESSDSKFPVVKLFQNARGISTVMFWIAYFMCLLMIYGLNTWLPNLMLKAGYAMGSSLSFLITLNAGAIVGTIVIGKMADKWGSKRMLIPMYILGAISLTLLGIKSNMFILSLLVGITGACTIGAQNIANAYVSQYYPPFARSTALGISSGVGRIGAIIGPTLGGVLLTLSLPIQWNFISFAIPGVIAALALWFVSEKKTHIFMESI